VLSASSSSSSFGDHKQAFLLLQIAHQRANGFDAVQGTLSSDLDAFEAFEYELDSFRAVMGRPEGGVFAFVFERCFCVHLCVAHCFGPQEGRIQDEQVLDAHDCVDDQAQAAVVELKALLSVLMDWDETCEASDGQLNSCW
jgi:hypothetical protein